MAAGTKAGTKAGITTAVAGTDVPAMAR